MIRLLQTAGLCAAALAGWVSLRAQPLPHSASAPARTGVSQPAPVIAMISNTASPAPLSVPVSSTNEAPGAGGTYSFIRPNFYSYATGTGSGRYGSGQMWCAVGSGGCSTPTQEPWLSVTGALPGIDQTVGYSTARALVDPVTARPSGTGSYGVPPSLCSYQSTTSPKRLYCNLNGTSGSYYIGGLNYISPSLNDCVQLYIVASSSTATITIDNFLTGYGPKGVSNCDTTTGSFVVVGAGATANIVVSNFEVDGVAVNGTGALSDHYTHSQSAAVNINTSGSLTFSNFAILDTDARPIGGSLPSSLSMSYGYIEGYIMGTANGSGAPYEHGESAEIGSQTMTYDHMVIFSPSSQPPGNTALIDLTQGQASTLNNVTATVTNSLLLSNVSTVSYYTTPTTFTPPGIISSAAIELAYITYGNVHISNTFVDTVGVGTCIQNAGGNATSIAGSIAPGLITVTGLTGRLPYGVDANGQQQLLANVTGLNAGTKINGGGTGTGGTGTYPSNTTQTITSFSGGKSSPSPISGTLTPTTIGATSPQSTAYSLETGNKVYYLSTQGSSGCK